MRNYFVITMLAINFAALGQGFNNLTLDSLINGDRLVKESVALERPIMLIFEPQSEVSGSLIVGTLYGQSAHVDRFGYDPDAPFSSLGQVLYADIPIGSPCVFFEERCYTLQYWDWGKMNQVGNSTTVCITDEMVDKFLEDGIAEVDGGMVVATDVVRTARDRDETVHVSWME
jgi:hypothetical protein